jgi:ATP-dependent Clp protease ATP-binding subunit ClpA
MFARFTERARQVIVTAQEESQALGHNWIGTEHLLLGLARHRETIATRVPALEALDADGLREAVIELIGRGRPDADALASIGIDLDAVRRSIESAFGPGALERTRHGCIPFTPRAKKSIELALREARSLGNDHIECVHLLLGLAHGEGVARELLEARGLDYKRLRALVVDALAA